MGCLGITGLLMAGISCWVFLRLSMEGIIANVLCAS